MNPHELREAILAELTANGPLTTAQLMERVGCHKRIAVSHALHWLRGQDMITAKKEKLSRTRRNQWEVNL